MNKGLNQYLDELGATPLDERVLKAYAESMKERTLPEIKRRVRENEERAAEIRFLPRTALRRNGPARGKKA